LIDLPEATDASMALKLDDHSALVGVQGSHHLYRVVVSTSTATAERVETVPPNLPLRAAFSLSDGSWVLSSDRGEIFHAALTNGRLIGTQIATSTSGDAFWWIDGARSATGAPDLVALGYYGTWVHLAGGALRPLDRLGVVNMTFSAGGTVWIGPSEFVAVKESLQTVERWKDGHATQEVAGTGAEAFWAAQNIPGFGVVIGSSTGTLYLEPPKPGGGWVRLGDSSMVGRLGIRAFAPRAEGGFYFGGARGSIGQYSAPLGTCIMETTVPRTVVAIVPLSDGILLVGTVGNGETQLTVTLVRPGP
jgi:hypothetical protein